MLLSPLSEMPEDLLGKLLYNHSQYVRRQGFEAVDPEGEIAFAMNKFAKVWDYNLWHRGFLLVGNPGTSKSAFLKAIQISIVRDVDSYGRNDSNEAFGGFRYMCARNLVHPYADISIFDAAAETGTLVIDDIDLERSAGENLMLARSLIGELIKRRYDAGLFTILGSVFDAENLGEVHDNNIFDIIRETYAVAGLSHNFRRDIILKNEKTNWNET